MRFSKIKILSTAGLIFIGVVAGIIFSSNMDWTPKGFASKNTLPLIGEQKQAASDAVLQLQNTGKAFTAVSKEVLPTVVSVSTSKIVKRSQEMEDFFGPFFRDFFGRNNRSQQPQTQRLQGLGSGVIVHKDGYVLTNNHVIEGADDIKITLYDNRTFDAKLVGTDPLTEIAVVKIDGKDLPMARLGDSEELEVGEWVLAFGNPMQLRSTVTAGIVSAKGRSIGIIQDEEQNQSSSGSYAIENFIQTDAAINPGNSGGALVNLKGEVIGINTAIATRTGYYQGYGFAVPINLARKIMNDLIQKGYVTRAWIGIGMRPVTENIAEKYNLPKPQGILIDQVMDDSPAQKADLKPLDIILKVDGREMNQSNEVQNYVAMKNPNDEIVLTILRNGVTKSVRVVLGQRETGKEAVVQKQGESDELPELGLTVEDLTTEIRNEYDIEAKTGVFITDVEPYSVADDAGIDPGDVIVRIEDKPVPSVSEYRRVIRGLEKGKVVIFYLTRNNNELHAFVKLPK